MRARKGAGAALAALSVLCLWVSPARAGTATTKRASVATGGGQAFGGNSYASDLSSTGRYVAFESKSGTLVPGDTNSVSDIFVRDLASGRTSRVSVPGGGGQANGESHSAAISPDGRYAVFESFASNLVSGDTNGSYDAFLRDRTLRKTYRVSVGLRGAQGNLSSSDPVVSADGRYVAFESAATNLASGDTNGTTDVFLRDRAQHRTVRVSVTSGERQGLLSSSDPAITPDGRYVVFESRAHLVRGDTNNETDIYLRDRMRGKTYRVSLSSGERQGNAGSHSAMITPDGRYVAFESFSDNLVRGDTNHVADAFLRDRAAGKTYRVSLSSGERQGNGFSADPEISANGQRITFESRASNLVKGDTNGRTDVFVRIRGAGVTRRVSVSPSGRQGNAESSDPAISADGRFVSFESPAANLVSGDTNGRADVFVRGPLS